MKHNEICFEQKAISTIYVYFFLHTLSSDNLRNKNYKYTKEIKEKYRM